MGRFDSVKEWKWYMALLADVKAGRIEELHRQVKYTLIPTQRDEDGKVVERECAYYADFTYQQDGQLVVMDVKSPITRKNHEYIIKRKLMLFLHGIRVKEV